MNGYPDGTYRIVPYWYDSNNEPWWQVEKYSEISKEWDWQKYCTTAIEAEDYIDNKIAKQAKKLEHLATSPRIYP